MHTVCGIAHNRVYSWFFLETFFGGYHYPKKGPKDVVDKLSVRLLCFTVPQKHTCSLFLFLVYCVQGKYYCNCKYGTMTNSFDPKQSLIISRFKRYFLFIEEKKRAWNDQYVFDHVMPVNHKSVFDIFCLIVLAMKY